MHRPLLLIRLLVAALVAGALGIGLVQTAGAEPQAPGVPGTIAVPAGHKVFLVGHAVGVQIYSCNATATGFAWSLVAPRADLYNDHGQRIITHFGGPTWQAKDGSTVVGQRVDGVTVDADAIPWLLLAKASTAAGPDGDRLTETAFIQRTATTGGLAPAAATCTAAGRGRTVEVPYTADYHFWKRTGR